MSSPAPQQTFSITGMHCSGCVAKVTDALRRVSGVTAAAVTLEPPEARINVTRAVTLTMLEAALAPLGKYHLQRLERQTPKEDRPRAAPVLEDASRESLYPLFLIIAYLVLTVTLIAYLTGDVTARTLMSNFMAGFFLVFSFFKLLDLKGFTDAYGSYDLVAQKLPAWGRAYPFIELGLGAAYLLRLAPTATNVATLLLMTIGAAGVWRALRNKQKLRCACLGTALNLPMTTVTLVEDIGMAAMAGGMLLIH